MNTREKLQTEKGVFMKAEEIFKKLKEPFQVNEIEWRVQQSGESNGKVWCMVLAYIDARAIDNRLDDVLGCENWYNSLRKIGEDDYIEALTIVIDGKEITKEDGASKTGIEGHKGAISGSHKRVASKFGIGRYLYDLDTVFAEVSMEKQSGDDWIMQTHKSKESNKYIKYWFKKPTLPDFAKPKIDNSKVEEIEQLIKETETDKNALLKHFQIDSLTQMSENIYGLAKAMLEKKKAKK